MAKKEIDNEPKLEENSSEILLEETSGTEAMLEETSDSEMLLEEDPSESVLLEEDSEVLLEEATDKTAAISGILGSVKQKAAEKAADEKRYKAARERSRKEAEAQRRRKSEEQARKRRAEEESRRNTEAIHKTKEAEETKRRAEARVKAEKEEIEEQKKKIHFAISGLTAIVPFLWFTIGSIRSNDSDFPWWAGIVLGLIISSFIFIGSILSIRGDEKQWKTILFRSIFAIAAVGILIISIIKGTFGVSTLFLSIFVGIFCVGMVGIFCKPSFFID